MSRLFATIFFSLLSHIIVQPTCIFQKDWIFHLILQESCGIITPVADAVERVDRHDVPVCRTQKRSAPQALYHNTGEVASAALLLQAAFATSNFRDTAIVTEDDCITQSCVHCIIKRLCCGRAGAFAPPQTLFAFLL